MNCLWHERLQFSPRTAVFVPAAGEINPGMEGRQSRLRDERTANPGTPFRLIPYIRDKNAQNPFLCYNYF